MPAVAGCPHRRAVVRDPDASIVVEKDLGIDAVDFGQEDGLRPRACRALCRDDEVAAALGTGVGDVEPAIMVADRRREDCAGNPQPRKIEHVGPVDRIADLRPVDQIATVENRQAGVETETRIDEVIVVADADDTRVGVEAGQDGIAEVTGLQRHRCRDRVMAAIRQIAENGGVARRRSKRARNA